MLTIRLKVLILFSASCTKHLAPFGADKTMTAVLSGEADIGFMGSKLPFTRITKALLTLL